MILKTATDRVRPNRRGTDSIQLGMSISHPIIFRPIHYLGSKLRILDQIEQAINHVDPSMGRVCDLFSGSGSVALKLSHSRAVTSVDIQEYSRVICSALLFPTGYTEDSSEISRKWRGSTHSEKLEWTVEPIATYEAKCIRLAIAGDQEPLADFIENSSLIGYEMGLLPACAPELREALKKTHLRLDKAGFLIGNQAISILNFGGLYFSFLQAAHIDSLLELAWSVGQKNKDLFLSAIMSTASSVVNTIGKQFAQPIRPKKTDGSLKTNLGERVIKDRAIDVFSTFADWVSKYQSISKSEKKHQVLRMDFARALDSLPKDTTTIYADPPYTRDHYSRYYHVLETLSLRDKPEVSTTLIHGERKISRGVYRIERHQSPFCIKSQAPHAFELLFQKVRKRNASLVLSYSPFSSSKESRPRLMTMPVLTELAKKHFSSVETVTLNEIVHSKLNHTEKNFQVTMNAETLLICKAK
jgi:adenine-specific DNA methylase